MNYSIFQQVQITLHTFKLMNLKILSNIEIQINHYDNEQEY